MSDPTYHEPTLQADPQYDQSKPLVLDEVFSRSIYHGDLAMDRRLGVHRLQLEEDGEDHDMCSCGLITPPWPADPLQLPGHLDPATGRVTGLLIGPDSGSSTYGEMFALHCQRCGFGLSALAIHEAVHVREQHRRDCPASSTDERPTRGGVRASSRTNRENQ